MAMHNKSNGYVNILAPGVFDKVPKAVFAAIAISYMVNHLGIDLNAEAVTQETAHEWNMLYLNGLVPQKPTLKAEEEA